MKELTFSQFNRELNRMYKECNEFYHALAKHFGLSDSAFWILYTLREEGRPLSATDLGGCLLYTSNTIPPRRRKDRIKEINAETAPLHRAVKKAEA